MSDKLDLIAHVIQLSIAPVFLLTGIAGLLGVMTNRLGRVIDRARALEPQAGSATDGSPVQRELKVLARRARLISRAITFGVLSALLVCAVIVGLFVTAYYAWTPDLTRVVAFIFGCALLALIAGLLLFLREVYVATATLRIGVPKK
ncbi:MAG TPA: DUF2721 domain-containing protein [Burkholderiaceae bacterium]|jgi:hypothetical protein|nr:DUF2721 domain-containing protein [Burkholderiaceae bacterium]